MTEGRRKVPDFFSTQVLEANRFYLDAYTQAAGPLTVVCGGYEHCRPGYRIDRKDFPFHSIEFVARGKGQVRLGGVEYPLATGSVFAYGPSIAHRITTDPNDPMVKYFVDFTGPDARVVLDEHGPAPGDLLQVASPHAILPIFDNLVREGQGDTRYTPLLCTVILRQLIFKIAETTVHEHIHSTPAFSTYQRCREHIRKHYMELRDLDTIAEQCNIDPAYLCRLFKRFDEHSPYRYLMRLKMNTAAHRLQQPDTLIKEVAYEFGYHDPFHFSRAFKKVFGISPETFRRLR